jgi:hypothetical protein
MIFPMITKLLRWIGSLRRAIVRHAALSVSDMG